MCETVEAGRRSVGAGGWEGLQFLSKFVKEGLVEKVTFEHRCLD